MGELANLVVLGGLGDGDLGGTGDLGQVGDRG